MIAIQPLQPAQILDLMNTLVHVTEAILEMERHVYVSQVITSLLKYSYFYLFAILYNSQIKRI